MAQCPDTQQLDALAHARLKDSEAARVQAHVDRCNACQGVIASLTEREETLALRPRVGGEVRRDGKPGEYSFLQPAQSAEEMGRLANYRVLRVLGKGGMGIVFLAEDLTLHRLVALKVLKPNLHDDPDSGQRFLREARTLAALKHEHLVTVYQAGQEGEAIYYAMELQQGETLDDWLQHTQAPSISAIARIGRDVASGLAFIHQQGLVHRDIKPSNIWLEASDGKVKILDLGLARAMREDVALTQAGTILGTPGFMSPEQARGKPLDARSDLFSLGCVLYWLCTGGTLPFRGESTMAMLTALAVDEPTPVQALAPRMPTALAELVTQLLAKRPEARPASADVVRARLAALASNPTVANKIPDTVRLDSPTLKRSTPDTRVVRRQWRYVPAAVAAAVLLGLGLWALGAYFRPPPPAPPEPPVGMVFVRDLPEAGRENFPLYPPGPDEEQKGPKGKKKKGPVFEPAQRQDPPPVRVRGRPFDRAIFMHPPPFPNVPASLSFHLGKRFRTFQTQVSLNDLPERPESPCTFTVFGDGRLLWQSRPVHSQDDTQTCQESVEGVDILKLAVTCPGPPRAAHAVWLDPAVGQ